MPDMRYNYAYVSSSHPPFYTTMPQNTSHISDILPSVYSTRLNTSDSHVQSPCMASDFHRPKILNFKYPDARDWSAPPSSPALHRQVSRETSYGSIRTPASVAFPGHIGVGSNIPPPSPGYYHRHKSSTFSIGPETAMGDWSSRQGWTPATVSAHIEAHAPARDQAQAQAQAEGQGQTQGDGGRDAPGGRYLGYGRYHQNDGREIALVDAKQFYSNSSRFPKVDPSSVNF